MRDRSPTRSGRVRTASSVSPDRTDVTVEHVDNFQPYEQKIVHSGDTRQSENYEEGASGWYQDGDGNAELNEVTLRGDLLVTDGTKVLRVSPDGVQLPISDSFAPPYGPWPDQLGDVQWLDEDEDVRGFIRSHDGGVQVAAVPKGAGLQVLDASISAYGGGLVLARAGVAAGGSLTDPPVGFFAEKFGDGDLGNVEIAGRPHGNSQHSGGQMVRTRSTTNHVGFTAETTIVQIGTVDIRSGRVYRATATVPLSVSNADTRVNLSIDLNLGTSDLIRYPGTHIHVPGHTLGHTAKVEVVFHSTGGTLSGRTVRFRVGRRDGTGTITTFASSEQSTLVVEDIGRTTTWV